MRAYVSQMISPISPLHLPYISPRLADDLEAACTVEGRRADRCTAAARQRCWLAANVLPADRALERRPCRVRTLVHSGRCRTRARPRGWACLAPSQRAAGRGKRRKAPHSHAPGGGVTRTVSSTLGSRLFSHLTDLRGRSFRTIFTPRLSLPSARPLSISPVYLSLIGIPYQSSEGRRAGCSAETWARVRVRVGLGLGLGLG